MNTGDYDIDLARTEQREEIDRLDFPQEDVETQVQPWEIESNKYTDKLNF